MDSFTYKYNVGTNQLNHVSDNVPDGDYASPGYEDTDGQDINNYTYDPIGNLIIDSSENITNISWNVYGKITLVNYSNTTSGTIKNVYYYYDAVGNRMGKRAEKNTSTGTSNTYTWYVRDASGNVMATYGSTANNSSNPGNLSVKERHMYGSSRLGILALSKDVRASMPSYTQTTPYKSSFIRGFKYYELANHLGNVLATVSDKKFAHTTNGTVDYYNADMVSATDYMPFGSSLPNRSFGSSAYRYAFNGKEKDKDGTGTSIQYDYGFRIYDPHLGRFKSVDPLTQEYPWYSPYQFAGNKPIWAIDLDGLEEYLLTNYYDKKGRIEETTITILNIRGGGREDMKLQDANGGYLAKKNVLVRNVRSSGYTTYQHQKQLNPEQASIVAEATKELIAPKVSPFALEGGRGSGKINDGGNYFTTERDDYTNNKYEAVNYGRQYTFLPDKITAGKNFAIINLNGRDDVMKNIKGDNVLNGTVDEFSKDFKALPGEIKKDKTIKSVDVDLVWDVGSGVTGQSLDIVKRAIERTGQDVKNHLLKSGVKNVNVKTSVNVTNNIQNSDALTIKLNR